MGRSLDPSLDLLKAAAPYVVTAVEGRVKHWLYARWTTLYHRVTGRPHPGEGDDDDTDGAWA